MKSLCLGFALLIGTPAFAALNCNGNLEAEVIGQIANVTHNSAEAGAAESTSYNLKNFRFFQENMLCALDDSLAATAVISAEGYLNLEDGQEISGVLVFNPKFNQFSLQ